MEVIKKYWYFIVLSFVVSGLVRMEFAFFILSLLILYFNCYYYIGVDKINKIGIETTVEILFYGRDRDLHKTPIIKFYIGEREIQKEPFYYASTDLSKFKTYKNNINKPIPIKYNPINPEEFIICSEKNFSWGAMIFTTLIGLIFLFVSIAGLLEYIDFSK